MSKKDRKQKQMEREIRRNKQFQYNQENKGEMIQKVKQNSLLSSSQDNSLSSTNKEIDDYLDKIQKVKQNSLSSSTQTQSVIHCPWEDTNRKYFHPSKERLEKFLNEIGGKSPFDYSNKENIKLDRKKKTTKYLWFTWRELMGFGGKGDVLSGKTAIITDEVFDWFVELEHLITNNEMFWGLFKDVWCFKSECITDNPQIFERYGRDKVPFETRLKCDTHFNTVSGSSITGSTSSKYDTWMMWLENQPEEMTIYRSFKVQKGNAIRKGVKKIDNPFSHIQEEGKGWSYSNNKTNAIIVNGVLSTFFYKKYLNLNDEKSKVHMQKHRGLSHHKMKDITLFGDFYNCIGIYKVRKKDIMFLTDDWGESEIIVNPKDVELIDYRFLNILDLISQTMCLGFLNFLEGGRSSVLNIDGVYDHLRKGVKKMITKYPHMITKYLTKENKRKLVFSKEFVECCGIDGVFQDILSFDNGDKKFVLGYKSSAGDYDFFGGKDLKYFNPI